MRLGEHNIKIHCVQSTMKFQEIAMSIVCRCEVMQGGECVTWDRDRRRMPNDPCIIFYYFMCHTNLYYWYATKPK